MTRFRLHYRRAGYAHWCCRIARRRTISALRAEPVVADDHAPSTARWRRKMPLVSPPAPATSALRVGEFVVGDDDDPQLFGHPDIRY